MGTSSSYGGPSAKNPLIPTWLEDPEDDGQLPIPPPEEPQDQAEQDPHESPKEPDQKEKPSAQPPPPVRFRDARNNLSRYVRSGGGNKQSLRRAVSHYVSKSNGGSSNAAIRMGSSRAAAGRLLGFLADAQARGVAQALQTLNLGSLIGKSADELFLGLAEHICPSEGAIDAGIARDAYTETVVEVLESGIESLDGLTEGQVGLVFETFLTNSIFERLCNDVSAGMIHLTKDSKEAASIQGQVKDFLRGAVRDALAQQFADMKTVSQSDTKRIATAAYEQAFSILAAYNEQ